MRLTVLGSSASYAGAGRACAGHLVEGGGVRVLFDCGNGVLANLCSVMDPLDLDAVFVTHYHPDHYVDLFALQALLRYAPDGPAPAIPVFVPPGLRERMKCLLSERGSSELDEAFAFSLLGSGEDVTIGGLMVTPVSVDHTDPTFALRAKADGALLAYTADSAPGMHVIDVLADADLALAEATLPEKYEGAAPHLTGSQAGTYAREARVSRLVLAHIWPTADRDEIVRVASAAFGGPVDVASEFDTYEVHGKERS